jgi:hypothetical protein
MQKKLVKLSKPCGIYSPGDVAGFDPERADAYVRVGSAAPYEATTAAAAPVIDAAPAPLAAAVADPAPVRTAKQTRGGK